MIKEVTMFRVICDDCGASAQEGDYYAWADTEGALEEASGADWIMPRGGVGPHICRPCFEARAVRMFGGV